MSTETPIFTTKPLEEPEEPKKRRVRSVRKSPRPGSDYEMINKKAIDQKLTSIYQDGSGHLPNMKVIKMKKGHPVIKFFISALLLGALLSAAAWAGFIFLPQRKGAASEPLIFSIDGPKRAPPGAPVAYTVKFSNRYDVALKNLTLSLRHPANFVFASSTPAARNAGRTEWQFPSLSPGKQKEVAIMGFMFASESNEQSWRAVLTYQPSNLASELQKMAVLNVSLEEAALELAINGPTEAKVGDEVEYAFSITDNKNFSFSELEIKPILPTNFHVSSSSPERNKNGAWSITSTPEGGESPAMRIRGRFSSASSSDSVAVIQGVVSLVNQNKGYPLNFGSATTSITEANLNFSVAINGLLSALQARPGETLNITVHLKNTTNEEMSNAVLKLIIDAPSVSNQSLLNWKEINDPADGDIRGVQIHPTLRRGEISWSSRHVAGLKKIKPDEELDVNLTLPVKDTGDTTLGNFTTSEGKIKAELTYAGAANTSRHLSSNELAITFNSDLSFETRDEATLNGGEENHAITWILNNNFHPLKNITVAADAYGDVVWSGNPAPPAGSVSFNDSAQKITWTIPEMPESVDVLALNFNIILKSKNPTQRVLISKARIEAEDAVTGQKIILQGEETGLK